MTTFTSEIVINKDIAAVFNYIDDANKFMAAWPGNEKIDNLTRLEAGGNSFDYTNKVAGMRLTGKSYATEFVQNERMVYVSEGGVKSTLVWTFQAEGEGTKITLETDYTVPVPLLGKLAEAAIKSTMEEQLQGLLNNLKTNIEAE